MERKPKFPIVWVPTILGAMKINHNGLNYKYYITANKLKYYFCEHESPEYCQAHVVMHKGSIYAVHEEHNH